VRFGLRSRDKIDVGALVQKRQAKGEGVERRAKPRTADQYRPPVALVHQNNRLLGRPLEWSALAIAAAGLAGFLASEVGAVLSQPLHQAQRSLDTNGR
jgi:hypothetical protein